MTDNWIINHTKGNVLTHKQLDDISNPFIKVVPQNDLSFNMKPSAP